jgi:translation initiation factor eIF-2B subunit beta
MVTSLFDLFSFEDAGLPTAADDHDSAQSPPAAVPNANSAGNSTFRHGGAKRQYGAHAAAAFRDLKADIIGGIEEIIDELGQVDDQIAAYALEHIHANEMILTHSSSLTVQKFFLKAAAKRKFTVVHAESAPNEAAGAATSTSPSTGNSKATEHDANAHDDILSNDAFRRPLMAAGLTVVVISDAAVFALMSRVNKVILGTHAVLANGGLVAAAGARMIAGAARAHRTPVVIVSGVYKLSPVYPFDVESLIEHGGAGAVVDWRDGEFVERVDVLNPLYDYVPAELVDLYITNL